MSQDLKEEEAVEDVGCVRQLSVAVAKSPDKIHLKEEGFTLIHDFEGFSPWLAGRNTEAP